MFGAFKPSAPLSGGLLWKIPWRMSAPQKLRQRRRLRRVDNIVSVLDTALKRQTATTATTTSNTVQNRTSPTSSPSASASGTATPSDLSTTLEGRQLLPSSTSSHNTTSPPSPTTSFYPLLAADTSTTSTQNTITSTNILPSEFRSLVAQTARAQGTIKLIERWKAEMPTEEEMLPRDKYTMFDRKQKKYRKGVHKLPKWTRVSQRLNPPGF